MTANTEKRAVVLVSGGLDSTTVLAIACADGWTPYALTFDYGQRHAVELTAARAIAKAYNAADHQFITIRPAIFNGSALTDDIAVPRHRSCTKVTDEIPVTYVPARNTIFLSYALAYAETIGSTDIFIGVNAVDYSGYPDCRPEFIAAFAAMANLATKAAVDGNTLTIHTPLITLTKAAIIARGLALKVDYATTHSCYDPSDDGGACGECDSCQLRAQGFAEATVPDPTHYSTNR